MEYHEIGDLFTYLHKKGPVPPLPETEAKEIAYQVLDGLSMMHENGFAHRDLKPHVGLNPKRLSKSIHESEFLEYPH